MIAFTPIIPIIFPGIFICHITAKLSEKIQLFFICFVLKISFDFTGNGFIFCAIKESCAFGLRKLNRDTVLDFTPTIGAVSFHPIIIQRAIKFTRGQAFQKSELNVCSLGP